MWRPRRPGRFQDRQGRSLDSGHHSRTGRIRADREKNLSAVDPESEGSHSAYLRNHPLASPGGLEPDCEQKFHNERLSQVERWQRPIEKNGDSWQKDYLLEIII